MPSISKICPSCQAEYGPDEVTCPEDGAKLIRAGRGSDRRIGEEIDDKLTITGVLGEGGMGTVYRAMQHSMDREVAVKVLRRSLSDDAEVVRRFLVEAKSASRLNHPHIITLFDFGQSAEGELYLMMELLQGQTLAQSLTDVGRMSPERAVVIVSQVCDAVQYAHDQGLIHRDLKPENVFVSSGAGRMGEFVKVLDFGLAKAATGEGSTITQTGMVCGTPAYMSPEQATGQDLDRRSDLYSVGVMLFELLSGRLPFEDSTPIQQLMAHVQKTPPRFAEACPDATIPAALEAVVQRCMAKAPADRPASAAVLKAELQSVMGLSTGTQPVPTSIPADTGRSSGIVLASAIDTDAETGAFEAPAAPPKPASTRSVSAVQQPAPAKQPVLLWIAFAIVAAVAGVLAWQALQTDDARESSPGRVVATAPNGTPRVAGSSVRSGGPSVPGAGEATPGALAPNTPDPAAPAPGATTAANPMPNPGGENGPEPPAPETTPGGTDAAGNDGGAAAENPRPPVELAPRSEEDRKTRRELSLTFVAPPIRLDVHPDSTTATLDGKAIPLDQPIARPPRGETLSIRLKARGHKSRTVTLDHDSDELIEVRLRRRGSSKPTTTIIR